MREILLVFLSLLTPFVAIASDASETVQRNLHLHSESEVFATMGDVVVTHADFDAFIDQRPADSLSGDIFSRNGLERILDVLIGDRLLAHAAIADGLLDDPRVQAQLLDNAYRLLGNLQITRYLNERELDDYSQQARELWLLMDEPPHHPPKFDFTHLLVSFDGRSEAEAARRVLALYDRVVDGEVLEDLIAEYSDDPTVPDNQGRYVQAGIDTLDSGFSQALQTLRNAGEISQPVQSEYGWHIIRLDLRHEPEPMTYDEMHAELQVIARTRHRERLRNNYLSEIGSQPMQVAEGAVQKIRQRYGFAWDQVSE